MSRPEKEKKPRSRPFSLLLFLSLLLNRPSSLLTEGLRPPFLTDPRKRNKTPTCESGIRQIHASPQTPCSSWSVRLVPCAKYVPGREAKGNVVCVNMGRASCVFASRRPSSPRHVRILWELSVHRGFSFITFSRALSLSPGAFFFTPALSPCRSPGSHSGSRGPRPRGLAARPADSGRGRARCGPPWSRRRRRS